MLDSLTRSSFEPHLNTVFELTVDEGPVELRLVEATDKTPAGFPGEQFSLIFSGPSDPALEQQIYSLRHEEMGRIDLFLVPVGMRIDLLLYEAFFNRSVVED